MVKIMEKPKKNIHDFGGTQNPIFGNTHINFGLGVGGVEVGNMILDVWVCFFVVLLEGVLWKDWWLLAFLTYWRTLMQYWLHYIIWT